jgi:hypothetical protein
VPVTADPVGPGAQSDLIGAPKPMSIEAVLDAQIGAYAHCCLGH